MKAIAIHRWDNAGHQINIKANTDDDLKVQSIALEVSDTRNGTSGNAVFTLQPGFVLSAAPIDNDKLMSWSAIQEKLAQLRSTTGAAAIAELEKARDLLHANLAQLCARPEH
ncbi:hypothetical protein [Pseudomonas rubra]|uniref:Uncharacterized protein n=1 Tax=Pseudomonas rubra TaxID=2942627 RepID=A0ABT5PC53_9PSED|nr:hypothetical protein [Pseudomonas rubra]MDD1015882.1 hypothetical protein [Pseudomonas rubra]MDD1040215.1 hypothetical protein [Pseudomonas rubra]MDD1157910.1 hypothetical protein [Pseudomonas rubra]